MTETQRRQPRAKGRRFGRAKSGNQRAATSKVKLRRGTVGDEQPLIARLGAYVQHHRSSAKEALLRLVVTPEQTLPTCLVIAIALALPALLYLGLVNMERQVERWQAPAQLSVFLHKRAQEPAISALTKQIDQYEQVLEWQLITPDQALQDFQSASGFGDVLASLDENPLPPVLVVTPAPLSVDQLAQLQSQLEQETVVDSVLLDLEWVSRLQQLVALIERVVTALGGLLAVGVILIVGNVIRLAISHRKDEIVIAKLVGASDGFVRRPFLYTGLWYGCSGGLMAVLLVVTAQLWLAGPIARLAVSYGSQFQFSGLGISGSLALVLAAAVLGSLGAWLSVSRHLAAIKPS